MDKRTRDIIVAVIIIATVITAKYVVQKFKRDIDIVKTCLEGEK